MAQPISNDDDLGFVPASPSPAVPVDDLGFVPGHAPVDINSPAGKAAMLRDFAPGYGHELKDLSAGVGTAIHYPFGLVKGAVEDVAQETAKANKIGAEDSLPLENLGGALMNEETPYEQRIKDVTGLPKYSAQAGQILSEVIPSMGVAGAAGKTLQAATKLPEWAAQGATAAAVFGSSKEGFDPKTAAVTFFFPAVGELGGSIATKALAKAGVSPASGIAENAIKSAGSAAAIQAYTDAVNSPEYLSKDLTPEQKKELFITGLAQNVGFHVAAIPGLIASGVEKDKIIKAIADEAKSNADQFWAGVQSRAASKNAGARAGAVPPAQIQSHPLDEIFPTPKINLPEENPNAIPIRKATPVDVGQAPENSGEVGARIPEPEKPADAQVQVQPVAPQEAQPNQVGHPTPTIDAKAVLDKLAASASGTPSDNGRAFALGATYTIDGLIKDLGLPSPAYVTGLRESGLIIRGDDGYYLNHDFYPQEVERAKKLSPKPVIESKPNPVAALPAESIPALKSKLFENMQGRTMDISAPDFQKPDAHLKFVLGKDAPSWKQLTDAGIITAQPNENGTVSVKVNTSEVPAIQVADKLSAGAAEVPSINPGGAQSELPPAQQAISKANNSREAFEALAKASGSKLPTADTSAQVQTIAGKMDLTEFEKKGYSPEQVTKQDWIDLQRAERRRLGQQEGGDSVNAPNAEYEEFHKQAVKEALSKGEEVDPEVLKDYPDLKKQPPTPPENPTVKESLTVQPDRTAKNPKVGEPFAQIGDYEFGLTRGGLSERPEMYGVGIRMAGSTGPFESGGYGYHMKPEGVIERWAYKEAHGKDAPQFSNSKAESIFKEEFDRVKNARDESAAKKKAESDAYEKKAREWNEYKTDVDSVTLPAGKKVSITVPSTEEGTTLTLTGTQYGDWLISKTEGIKDDPYKVTHARSGLGTGPRYATLSQAKELVKALIHGKVKTDFSTADEFRADKASVEKTLQIVKAFAAGGDVPDFFINKEEPPPSPPSQPEPPITPPPTSGGEVQKYRVNSQGPQLFSLVEKLPQSAAEKISAEQPVRVRNDKTGKEEILLESDLTPVKTRSAEEKVATVKRDLDAELRAAKLDPSVFQNDAQKREALKRYRATQGNIDSGEPQEIKELKATGLEQIKALFSDPATGLDARTRQVALAFIAHPVMRDLNWSKLTVQLTKELQGGLAGAADVANNLIQLSSRATPETFAHEMFHFLDRLLPDEMSSALNKARLEDLQKIYGDNIPQSLRDGTMTTDEFLQSGLPREVYHLINPSEYLAEFGGKTFNAEQFEGRNGQPASWWQQVHAKVQEWIKAIVNTLKRLSGGRQDKRSIYEDLLAGRYRPTPETGRVYDQRQGSLVRKPSEMAEVTKNEAELSDEENQNLNRNIQAQNSWVALPSLRSIYDPLPPSVKSKLAGIFGSRDEVLKRSVAKGPHDVSLDSIINNPDLREDQKMGVIGDIVDNNITAENQISKKQTQAQKAIEQKIELIKELTASKADLKTKRAAVRSAITSAIGDYQNQIIESRNNARDAGQAEAFNESLKQIESIKDGSVALERVFDDMAAKIPDELLADPKVTSQQVIDAYRAGRTDDQVANDLPMDKKVSTEMVGIAAKILLSSHSLGEDLYAAKHFDDASVEEALAKMNKDARKPDKNDLISFAAQMGHLGARREVLSSTLKKLNPRLYRATSSLSDWKQVQEALQQVTQDKSWRDYRSKAYNYLDVREAVIRPEGDTHVLMRNPLTGKDVNIPVTLDALGMYANQRAIKAVFDDAKAYLAAPDAPGWNPRTAAAWKYLVNNAEGYWLNPDLNPSVEHLTPTKFDLPKQLKAALPMLRTAVGGSREGKEVIVKLNALSAVDRQLQAHDHRYGMEMINANRRAAIAHGMSLADWNDEVFRELAGKQQYAGTVATKRGDTLISGQKVLPEDIAALDAQKLYTDKLRKIAEEGMGNAAVAINPARIVRPGYSRLSKPTSATGYTLPQYIAQRAYNWLRGWNEAKTTPDKIAWLNRPENFNDVLLAHMDMTATPKYAVKSPFEQVYKSILSDHRAGQTVESLDDVASAIFENQDTSDPRAVRTKDEIRGQILTEVNNLFTNVERNRQEKESQRANPRLTMFSADNAFTKARSESPQMPYSFMNYGAVDAMNRLDLAHDAKAWYLLELLGDNGAMDRLRRSFQNKQADYQTMLKQAFKKEKITEGQFSGATNAKMMSGDTLYDYNQVKLAVERINYLQREFERVYMNPASKFSDWWEKWMSGGVRTIGSTLLLNPTTRVTHTGGNLIIWGNFYKRLNQSLVARSAAQVSRIAVNLANDIALHTPGVKSTLGKIANDTGYPEFAQSMAQHALDRQDTMDRLRQLGIVSVENAKADWDGLKMDIADIRRQDTPGGPLPRIGKALRNAAHLYSSVALKAPGYNDWLMNSEIPHARANVVQDLAANALEYIGNRKAIASEGHAYDDLSDPRNRLTAQEIVGKNDTMAQTQANYIKGLFSENGMSLDSIYYRYFKAVEAVKAQGGDPSTVSFLTPGEEATLDFAIGQETGLATVGNRMLSSRGGGMRSFLGYLHGLPLWQLGNQITWFNKLNTKTTPQHLLALTPVLMVLAAYATAVGVGRQSSTKAINRALFNQATSLPTIEQARSAEDVAKVLARAWSSYYPIVGDAVNAVLLNQPDRFGNLDSMFVGWNFITDVMKTAGNIVHSGNIAQPATDFMRRWVPWSKAVINRLPSREGITTYYNSVSDIRAAAPSTMEQKARLGGAYFQPSATSTIVREMVNAAYRGDDKGFNEAYERAVEQKRKEGARNPELAVRESFMSHNPYLQIFKTLPTDQERAQILNHLTDAEKKEVEASEAVFDKYAQMIGGTAAFTLEQREGNKPINLGRAPSASGGGSPTRGSGGAADDGADTTPSRSGSGSSGGIPKIGGSRGRIRSRGSFRSSGFSSPVRRIKVNRLRKPSSHIGSGRRNRIRTARRRRIAA